MCLVPLEMCQHLMIMAPVLFLLLTGELRPFKSLGGASSGQEAPHPQDRPPDENYNRSKSRNIIYELPLYEKYGHILDSTQLEALVRTMYKRKDQKILPVNQSLPNGINPSGTFAPDPGGGLVVQ